MPALLAALPLPVALPTRQDTPYSKVPFTNTRNSLGNIRACLNDPLLSDAESRRLFGSIRRSLLDIHWQWTQLKIWLFRSTRIGHDYAQAVPEDAGVGADAGRYAFYRESDEKTIRRSGSRGEVIDMILKHVRLYHRGIQEVSDLHKAKDHKAKDRMLAGESGLSRPNKSVEMGADLCKKYKSCCAGWNSSLCV